MDISNRLQQVAARIDEDGLVAATGKLPTGICSDYCITGCRTPFRWRMLLTIARNKLYEMNVVISDTAEYGNYLFTHSCIPLLQDFMANIDTDVIGKSMVVKDNRVDNQQLIEIDKQIQNHPVERIGETLRAFMDNMKAISG